MARKSKKQLEAEVDVTAQTLDGKAADAVFDEVDASVELIDPTPRKTPKAKGSKPSATKATKPPVTKPKAPPAPPTERKPPTEEEEVAAAAPRQFLVVRGGTIMHRGFLTELRTGKTIRAGGYNIEQILQQGIELEEVKG